MNGGGRKEDTGMEQAVLEKAMMRALAEAEAAGQSGHVPVGAVLLAPDGAGLAQAHNHSADPLGHAEMLCLRQGLACWHDRTLRGCTLVVTLEPCPMCAGAIGLTGLQRLIFGAYDPKGGAVEHGPRLLSGTRALRAPEIIGGFMAQESEELLRRFFRNLRS